MAGEADAIRDAKQTIDEMIEFCPLDDEFDHGYGLDFSLALYTWIHVAPQVIQHVLIRSDEVEGAKRGHVLYLAFIAARPDVLESLRVEGKHTLAQQILDSLRLGYARFIRHLRDSHGVVRYWAIWGILMSDMPDTKAILTAHLSEEPLATNREVIASRFDPNWKPPARVHYEGIPF